MTDQKYDALTEMIIKGLFELTLDEKLQWKKEQSGGYSASVGGFYIYAEWPEDQAPGIQTTSENFFWEFCGYEVAPLFEYIRLKAE